MTVAFKVGLDLANDLRSSRLALPESQKVLDAAKKHNGSIRPMHPQINNPGLNAFFVVEVPTSRDATELAGELSSIDNVESAFVKPKDEPAAS